jgi:hypothetical protein
MIRPLRQRHRAVWSLLAIALPLLFIAALSARPQPSPAFELPAGLASAWGAAPPLGADAVRDAWQQAEGWRARRLRSTGRAGDAADGEGVEVELGDVAPEPDLLVYWVDGGEGSPTELSEALASAWLLGAAPLGASRVYALPHPGGAGTVVLYSLAHRSTYGALTLPAGGD